MARLGGSLMILLAEEREAIKDIDATLNIDQLIDQIKDISIAAWDGHLETLTIKAWINNFTGEVMESQSAEQKIALWLALNYVYYTDNDIRSLSCNLWWKLIHKLIEECQDEGFDTLDLHKKYEYILNRICIQPLGNCSGSGTNVAYFFRQSNGLAKELFEIGEKEIDYLVLVDDATISGKQANENLERYKKYPVKKIYVLTYISSDEAKKNIGESAELLSAVELDNHAKAFSNDSLIFKNHINWISISKKMCKHYGKRLDSRYPLGYDKGEYTFGFYYNTPNNTLPIFWGTFGHWSPLFTRYFSHYDKLEADLNEKFY